MVRFTVHALDVTGNKRSGFEVNDVYPSQGKIDVRGEVTKEKVVRALKRGGLIKKGIHMTSVALDEQGDDVYVTHAKNGKPELLLRAE